MAEIRRNHAESTRDHGGSSRPQVTIGDRLVLISAEVGEAVGTFNANGTSERDAQTMARLLVEQDMAQGDGHPKSHGTRCITNYHGEDAEHAGWQVRAHSHPPPASPTRR